MVTEYSGEKISVFGRTKIKEKDKKTNILYTISITNTPVDNSHCSIRVWLHPVGFSVFTIPSNTIAATILRYLNSIQFIIPYNTTSNQHKKDHSSFPFRNVK
jgi:hypothetical protein